MRSGREAHEGVGMCIYISLTNISFPTSSDDKEFACNVGDLGSIPG